MWMYINCSVLNIVCHYSFDLKKKTYNMLTSPFELVSFSDTSTVLGCTLPDKTNNLNNNQCRSIWTFRRLDQRDPLRLLPKDHEVEALAEAACIYSRPVQGWFTTHTWQFLIIFSVASSMPGQKKRVLRNCFVFTISWWVSCASDRICFRRDCGTTIRFHLRFTPSKIVNSSFMRLYGLRSCPLPIIPYVSHGKRALFFSLSCQRSKEEQKK